MTQTEFSEKTGVQQSTVSRWVNGRVPEGHYFDRIADALMVNFDAVAEQAGVKPKEFRVDPNSPEGLLVPLVRKVVWTDDRLHFMMASLRSMIEVDESNRKKKNQR
jgi:transcriptional regulator with XRE-family HTH domain